MNHYMLITALRILTALALSVLLASCAASIMTGEGWETRLAAQKSEMPSGPACCVGVSELISNPYSGEEQFHVFSWSDPLIEVGGQPRPALMIDIPESSAFLQFASYSDKTGGLVNFSTRMWIRPTVRFLNGHGDVLRIYDDLPLCFGEKKWKPVAWVNVEVPAGARQMLVHPTISKPVQRIDTTRRGASSGAVMEAVSDANNLSHAELRVGLLGPVGLEFLDSTPRILGTCRQDLPPEDSLTLDTGLPQAGELK